MAIVLIVDDHPANRELLVTLLGYRGHQLLEAADGVEALAVIRSSRPDLVLADILMPTMDGFELVRQLRADSEIAHIPVIFCTAHYHESEAQSLARSCGVASVLTKPCDPEAVFRAVDAALGLPFVPPLSDSIASPGDFNRDHVQLLTDKLSNKVNELTSANERLEAMVELGLELGSELDREKLIKAFCESARRIVGSRQSIVQVNGNGHIVHTSGMDAATAMRQTKAMQDHPFVSADPRRSFGMHHVEGVVPPFGDASQSGKVKSWLAVPIASPKRPYGWLFLIDKIGSQNFSAEDIRLANILSAQVGRIYENGSLYAEVLERNTELSQEVAERKRAEIERDRFFSQSLNLLFVGGFDGRFRRLNPAWERTLGFTPEELMAQPFLSLSHPDDRLAVLAELQRLAMGHATRAFHARCRTKDNSYKWILWNATPFRDLDCFYATGQDVHEHKQLEEQFRHAQKMEAVGRLAGGVAHDFNNLLTVILGYSQMMIDAPDTNTDQRSLLQEIRNTGDRAVALTRQLLAFSRKQVLHPEVLNVAMLLENVEKMLSRLIGEDIRMTICCEETLGRVKADKGQLEQVLMNLVVNARDAMSNGGNLTIEARNTNLDEDFATSHLESAPGAYVVISVSDDGCGMDEATQARVFEPFFTTKGPEKGTGLGLSTVYGIIKQSGGRLNLYSEVGTGTTFRIYLPRVSEEDGLPLPNVETPTIKKPGVETVLLVEDEDGVRGLAKFILEQQGYQVLEARHGREALSISQRYDGEIHLLMTDVVMPDVNGPTLVRHLNPLRPLMKVLFLSGYTNEAILRSGLLDLNLPFLEKPFSADGLISKVREVLGHS